MLSKKNHTWKRIDSPQVSNAPEKAHGFSLVGQEYLKEYDSTTLIYEHDKTGEGLEKGW